MKKYKEFLEDLLLESIDLYEFIYTPEFQSILDNIIDSSSDKDVIDIAKLYVNLFDVKIPVKYNLNFIDISDEVGFANIYKSQSIINDIINPESNVHDDYPYIAFPKIKKSYNPNRIKIGKLTNHIIKLFSEKVKPVSFSDSSIEKFVNEFKSNQELLTNNSSFVIELVDIKDMDYYYNGYNYYNEKGTLGNSCMKETRCQDYFDLYKKIKDLKIIVLLRNNLVAGRALLWRLNNGEFFMDRVYTNYEYTTSMFKKYAQDNKFLYKEKQQSVDAKFFMSPINNYTKPIDKKISINTIKLKREDGSKMLFPYMDTMKYFQWELGVLNNYVEKDGPYYVTLEGTEGECICSNCKGTGVELCDCDDGFTTNIFTNKKEICEFCDGTGEHVCEVCGGFSNTN